MQRRLGWNSGTGFCALTDLLNWCLRLLQRSASMWVDREMAWHGSVTGPPLCPVPFQLTRPPWAVSPNTQGRPREPTTRRAVPSNLRGEEVQWR